MPIFLLHIFFLKHNIHFTNPIQKDYTRKPVIEAHIKAYCNDEYHIPLLALYIVKWIESCNFVCF